MVPYPSWNEPCYLDRCRRRRETLAQEAVVAETPGCYIGGVETRVYEVLSDLQPEQVVVGVFTVNLGFLHMQGGLKTSRIICTTLQPRYSREPISGTGKVRHNFDRMLSGTARVKSHYELGSLYHFKA